MGNKLFQAINKITVLLQQRIQKFIMCFSISFSDFLGFHRLISISYQHVKCGARARS